MSIKRVAAFLAALAIVGCAFHATFSGRLQTEFDLVGRFAFDGQAPSHESFSKLFPPMTPAAPGKLISP